MKRPRHRVDALLARVPADDPEKPALQARAAEHGQECGCVLGALFLAVAVLLAVTYFAAGGELGLRTGLAAVALVFAAAILGKLTGLLVAALRLRLLARSIAGKLSRHQGHPHVHVH